MGGALGDGAHHLGLRYSRARCAGCRRAAGRRAAHGAVRVPRASAAGPRSATRGSARRAAPEARCRAVRPPRRRTVRPRATGGVPHREQHPPMGVAAVDGAAAHHQHRARRTGRHGERHGPDQHPGYGTEPAHPDDQRAGVAGRLQQRGLRLLAHHAGQDLDVRVVAGGTLPGPADDVLRALRRPGRPGRGVGRAAREAPRAVRIRRTPWPPSRRRSRKPPGPPRREGRRGAGPECS